MSWLQPVSFGRRTSAVSETGRSALLQAADRSTLEVDVRGTANDSGSTCHSCSRSAAASKGRELALTTLLRPSASREAVMRPCGSLRHLRPPVNSQGRRHSPAFMVLKFPNSWRFQPPEDGRLVNKALPSEAASELLALASKVATQGNSRWAILEHFKSYAASAGGTTHNRSSSESWAESDLSTSVYGAASNAPLLIEAFVDAFSSLARSHPDWWLPDETYLNDLFRRHRVGYRIAGSELQPLEDVALTIQLPATPPPTLAETARKVYRDSVKRAEQLLDESRPREAVQELLWLLETVATAFRGLETDSGSIAGKYFNQIARDLRNTHSSGALARCIDWMTALHGYLSSPAGGGVRHGLDLHEGVAVTPNEGRLYCNLIRSYIGYLLGEHERLSSRSER
jgi:hypothetical protein